MRSRDIGQTGQKGHFEQLELRVLACSILIQTTKYKLYGHFQNESFAKNPLAFYLTLKHMYVSFFFVNYDINYNI